ncbi:MAG TPA: hypothetical protein VFJ19_05880 [Nocardioidaceae bacterium]|nr:hypothetical protein [Nocardioidaceae bacterium]
MGSPRNEALADFRTAAGRVVRTGSFSSLGEAARSALRMMSDASREQSLTEERHVLAAILLEALKQEQDRNQGSMKLLETRFHVGGGRCKLLRDCDKDDLGSMIDDNVNTVARVDAELAVIEAEKSRRRSLASYLSALPS